MAKVRTAAVPLDHQEEQRRLLERAQREPGMAEAIEAYRRLAGVANSYRRDVITVGFSTGGNYPTDRPAQ